MAHNRVISTQATPWLKKTILRRLLVKYYYPDLTDAPQVADTQGAHRLLFRLQSGQGQLQRRQWPSGRGPGAYVQFKAEVLNMAAKKNLFMKTFARLRYFI